LSKRDPNGPHLTLTGWAFRASDTASNCQLKLVGETEVEADWVRIKSFDVANRPNIDISNLDDTFPVYIIELLDLVASENRAALLMRTSTDQGSSFDNDQSDYRWSTRSILRDEVVATQSSAADSCIHLSSNAQRCVRGIIVLPCPLDDNPMTWWQSLASESGTCDVQTGRGGPNNPQAFNAIRLYFASGDIESASIVLWGRKH